MEDYIDHLVDYLARRAELDRAREERYRTYTDFQDHRLDVLVATTHFEAGPSVPNASIVIVEQADRMRLSRLHRIRGHIAAGRFEPLCLLITGDHPDEEGVLRVERFAQSREGFSVSVQELEDRGLDDMVVEAWNGKDAAMLEQVYAPDAIHRAVYFDGVHEWVGREAVIEDAMLAVTVTSLGPIMELDAPDGELHWVSAGDVVTPSLAGMGTVCNLWARDGQVVRHDCLLSMDCPVGMCTP